MALKKLEAMALALGPVAPSGTARPAAAPEASTAASPPLEVTAPPAAPAVAPAVPVPPTPVDPDSPTLPKVVASLGAKKVRVAPPAINKRLKNGKVRSTFKGSGDAKAKGTRIRFAEVAVVFSEEASVLHVPNVPENEKDFEIVKYKDYDVDAPTSSSSQSRTMQPSGSPQISKNASISGKSKKRFGFF